MLLASTDCMAALSAWSSFGTFIVALFALLFAWCQIGVANSIRTTELIVKTYSEFVESDEMLEFYARIRRGDDVDWGKEEALLNRSLTLFDSLNFLQTQGLLRAHAKAWEYIASEIQYFASNGSVCTYIETRIREGRNRGFPDNIIPFTGFPPLLANIPPHYRAKGFPCIPEKYTVLRALADQELKSSRSLRVRIAHQLSRLICCGN
jgi:hypothetical protein